MIRKYSKFLLLLYVAFLMDFRAGASGGLSDRYYPQTDLQSDIDTIVLLKPDTIITDPFYGKIELYLRTELPPIWGTIDFPDSLIHFSVNNTYEWGAGDILSYDPPSRRYACESEDTDYFLDDTLNHVHFHASYIRDEVAYDTVASFPVHYTKPLVTVININNILFEDKTVVVNSATDVTFDINLNRAYQYNDPDGYDKVIALEARHNGGDWTLVWNDPAGVRDEPVEILLENITESLIPGYNTIEFRAKGKCETNCEEYSEILTVQIFYLNFEGISSQVCQGGDIYELIGIPEGGYFTGNGVIDETILFNPSLAPEGFITLTYHYLIEGEEYFVDKVIEISPLPDFVLNGDREVCYNGWEVGYEIISLTGNYDKITWYSIQGGEIYWESLDKSVVLIHWHGKGTSGEEIRTGKITVIMEKNGCGTTKEFLVDIRETGAPDPCFMMLYNNNLLVCDDTSALYFEWYINNELDTATQVPYRFLGKDFNPGIGAEFYVMTANDLCDTSCFTKSNTYVWSNKSDLASTMDQKELPVYPNPNNGDFTVLLPGDSNHECLLTVSDITGRVVTSISIDPSINGREFRVIGHYWPAGIYLLRLESNLSSLYKKIMIIK